MVGTTDAPRDLAEPGAQRRVVVDPRVPRDPGLRARWTLGLVDRTVRPSADDDRTGTAHGPVGVGRTIGISVGEPHAGVQPGGLAAMELDAGPVEHLGRRDAEMGDAVLFADRDDLVPRREWSGPAHSSSVGRALSRRRGT